MTTVPFITPYQRTLAEVEEIAATYGVTAAALIGRVRLPYLMEPRFHAYFHVWQRYGSLKQTGRFFDGRDHTTIAYGIGCHMHRLGIRDHKWVVEYLRRRQRVFDWHQARRDTA